MENINNYTSKKESCYVRPFRRRDFWGGSFSLSPSSLEPKNPYWPTAPPLSQETWTGTLAGFLILARAKVHYSIMRFPFLAPGKMSSLIVAVSTMNSVLGPGQPRQTANFVKAKAEISWIFISCSGWLSCELVLLCTCFRAVRYCTNSK